MTTTPLSAWVRLADAALPAERSDEIAEALESGRIVACLPFLLEAGYCLSLPHYHLDDAAEQRALDAQAQLARLGHDRLPPVDLLSAALADRHDLGALHNDHDYDAIAERLTLRSTVSGSPPAARSEESER